MARKRTPSLRRPAPRESKLKPIFSSPFKDLKKLVNARATARPQPPPAPAKPPPPTVAVLPPRDDAALLRDAFEGVRRLDDSGPARMPREPEAGRPIRSEDAEVVAQLSDLVSGQAPFDITETDEYVEGARAGLDPRLVIQLRRGEFATQAHIDLHGMTQGAAKEALSGFVAESVRKGHRAVLVVHGRGLRSPGGRPVLKHAAAHWLSHGVLSGHVLAFTTARPNDGGAGAVYVLLRRDRRRAPFDVLNGAKRHA